MAKEGKSVDQGPFKSFIMSPSWWLGVTRYGLVCLVMSAITPERPMRIYWTMVSIAIAVNDRYHRRMALSRAREHFRSPFASPLGRYSWRINAQKELTMSTKATCT